MTKLSVNINKVALIRNSREGNFPNLFKFAQDCEEFGAQGITVHPRPDERHIRYSDIPILKELNSTEFNIEGYPNEKFLTLIEENKPHQCTLVPDPPGVLTSSQGWDTKKELSFLTDAVGRIKESGVRVSLFLDARPGLVEFAKKTGADRIELYTGDYAKMYHSNKKEAIKNHIVTGEEAYRCNIGLNAGHDLNLDNLKFYQSSLSGLLEVSIGHALISDALYFGINNTIQMYLKRLES